MAEDESQTGERPAAPRPKAAAVSRKRVVSQLWRAAKRQLDAHEEHLADMPKGSAASEADAKALATLARTVRELVAIDDAPAAPTGQATAGRAECRREPGEDGR